MEATVKYLNLNLDLSEFRVPGNLPLELQIGSLHLLERNVQELSGTDLQLENAAVKSRQLALESHLAPNRFPRRQADLLAHRALKIAWFTQLSLDPRRAYL